MIDKNVLLPDLLMLLENLRIFLTAMPTVAVDNPGWRGTPRGESKLPVDAPFSALCIPGCCS